MPQTTKCPYCQSNIQVTVERVETENFTCQKCGRVSRVSFTEEQKLLFYKLSSLELK